MKTIVALIILLVITIIVCSYYTQGSSIVEKPKATLYIGNKTYSLVKYDAGDGWLLGRTVEGKLIYTTNGTIIVDH